MTDIVILISWKWFPLICAIGSILLFLLANFLFLEKNARGDKFLD